MATAAAIVLSALAYAGTSSGGLRVDVWMWAISYLLVLAFEMVYVKHVLNELPMSTWTRVYYNNALALLFCPPFFVGHENTLEVGLGEPEAGRAPNVARGELDPRRHALPFFLFWSLSL